MYANSEQIQAWAAQLTPEQMRKLIPELVQELMTAETIRFWDDYLLIEGQGWSDIGR